MKEQVPEWIDRGKDKKPVSYRRYSQAIGDTVQAFYQQGMNIFNEAKQHIPTEMLPDWMKEIIGNGLKPIGAKESDFAYRCPICDQIFARKTHLLTHLNESHRMVLTEVGDEESVEITPAGEAALSENDDPEQDETDIGDIGSVPQRLVPRNRPINTGFIEEEE